MPSIPVSRDAQPPKHLHLGPAAIGKAVVEFLRGVAPKKQLRLIDGVGNKSRIEQERIALDPGHRDDEVLELHRRQHIAADRLPTGLGDVDISVERQDPIGAVAAVPQRGVARAVVVHDVIVLEPIGRHHGSRTRQCWEGFERFAGEKVGIGKTIEIEPDPAIVLLHKPNDPVLLPVFFE